MGTDSGDHFRAESRDKSNEVQGVYGWIDPSGSTHTIGKYIPYALEYKALL